MWPNCRAPKPVRDEEAQPKAQNDRFRFESPQSVRCRDLCLRVHVVQQIYRARLAHDEKSTKNFRSKYIKYLDLTP